MKPEPIIRQTCGCKSRGNSWLELCVDHEAEDYETRKRWAEEHQAMRLARSEGSFA